MSSQVKVLLTAEDRTAAAMRSASSGLDKYSAAASMAQTALAGVMAAVSIGVIAAAARSTIDYADEMGKLALKAGTTTEAISGLAYAAALSDVDNKQLAKGLRELGTDAQKGGEKLGGFGIQLLDASGKAKTTEALFLEVSDRMAAIEDPAKRAAWASELFGDKIGPELLPLLISGSAGIKAMTDEAAKFGRVVSEEAAAKAAEFNDNLDRMMMAGQGVIQQLSGPMVAALATGSSYFLKIATDVGLARAALITFGAAAARTLGLDDVGKLQSQARSNANAVALTYKQIELYQKFADRGDPAAEKRVAELRSQFDRLQADGQRITAALKNEAKSIEDEFKPPPSIPPKVTVPDLPPLKKQPTEKSKKPDKEKNLDPLGDFIGGPQVQAAIDRTDAMARSAKKLYEQTRTPIEELAATESDLLRMRELGYIKEEEYWRGREAAADKYDEALKKVAVGTDQAAEQAKRLGDAFANTFENAFRNGMDLGDLLRKLAYDAINIQILTPATQKISGALGSAMSSLFSFDGGGYTGAGARSGGLDGKGGFMAVLHPNETILDHTKGQGSGGTTIVQNISVDARGADAGVEARIRTAMAQTKNETLAAVQARANRGGSFAAALGRA